MIPSTKFHPLSLYFAYKWWLKKVRLSVRVGRKKEKKELNSLVENTSALLEGSGGLLCFVSHVDSVCGFACNLSAETEA